MKSICGVLLLAFLSALPATGQVRAAKGLTSSADAPTVPPYCSPCLFYSGDFDPANPHSNALGNGVSLGAIVGPATIYIPFVVPAGQEWTIRGLFVNELASVEVLDPPKALWSISSGVSAGQAGTLVASGLGGATLTPTGRNWGGYAEFTVMAQVKEFQLQSGTYWLSLLPRCINKDDASCSQAEYFATDVEDDPPQNFKGDSPGDASFFSYPHSGDYYIPTWGFTGACGGYCDRFSAGAIGIARKAPR